VTHVAASNTYTYRLGVWARTKPAGSNPLPVVSTGVKDAVCALVAFRGPTIVTAGYFDTLADGQRAATPAADPADIRIWGTIANNQSITPSTGEVRANIGGTDIDICVTTGSETGLVYASVADTAGWCLATLSVGD
ncbi:MAG TPA: hypothetical protein VF049_04470, partial [Nocardioidaceae bacterium]